MSDRPTAFPTDAALHPLQSSRWRQSEARTRGTFRILVQPAQLAQLDQSSDKTKRLASAAEAWRACEPNFKALVAEARRNAIVWLNTEELRSMQPGLAPRDPPSPGLDELLSAMTWRQARWMVRRALRLLAEGGGRVTVESALG